MAEALASEPMPLVVGADGVIRVGGTRVTLETLLAAFAEGATAEEIAQQYPSISLADVYQVIGFYLRRPSELDPYLSRRRQKIDETRKSNDPSGRRPVSAINCLLVVRGSVALAG